MSVLERSKPFLAVIFIQLCYALMSIVAKLALNDGTSPRVLVAYNMTVASALISPFAILLERNKRPKMTFKLLIQVSVLSLFEPVVEQNLFYTGMKLTTATFTSAMSNVLPALTFIMACIFRLEKVDVSKRHSQGKLVGTIIAVGGAMLMTFVKGNVVELPWTNKARGFDRWLHPT
ncbi:PREDICTED: WAT1-related protein At5g13670-like, partial [Tarenaya hassleriana]|uniref:WAT1-related protein At5g13670-like n=1 Tax=Tarenaya hassleriana TaxID=28532 RepID=UPI0008FD81C5